MILPAWDNDSLVGDLDQTIPCSFLVDISMLRVLVVSGLSNWVRPSQSISRGLRLVE